MIRTVELGSSDRKPLAIEIEASKDCSSLLTKTLFTVGESLWLDISCLGIHFGKSSVSVMGNHPPVETREIQACNSLDMLIDEWGEFWKEQ